MSGGKPESGRLPRQFAGSTQVGLAQSRPPFVDWKCASEVMPLDMPPMRNTGSPGKTSSACTMFV